MRVGTFLTRYQLPYYTADEAVPRYGPALGRRKDGRRNGSSFRYPKVREKLSGPLPSAQIAPQLSTLAFYCSGRSRRCARQYERRHD